MRTSIWALAFLLLLVPVASAQNEPPPSGVFGERVDVEVVNVDVVVTDRDGRRVTDLGRDDFELRIDGKPVPIEYFATPRLAASRDLAPAPVTSLQTTTAGVRLARAAADSGLNPAYILVFVDESSLDAHVAKSIVDEIREFLVPRLDGSTAVQIAAFVNGMKVLGPMTTNAEEIEKELAALLALGGRGSLLETERNQLEREIRSSGAPASFAVEAKSAAEYRDSERRRLEAAVTAFAEQALHRQERSIEALKLWFEALAGIEGRKTMLLATPGYASNPVAYFSEMMEAKVRGSDLGRRAQVRVSISTLDALVPRAIEMLADFEAALRSARNARVAIYTISPRTVSMGHTSAEFQSSGGEVSASTPRDLAIVEAGSSVVRLAESTGGASFPVDVDLSRRLETVADDENSAYSLGFALEPSMQPGEHAIEVRVRRGEVRVRHRESFGRRTAEERAKTALLAAVSFEKGVNTLGLGMELGAPARIRGKKGVEVELLVRIPLRTLALRAEGDGRAGRLTARVAIQDTEGEMHLGEPTPIHVVVPASDAARIATHNWAYRARLRLAPGENRVAVVVVDELSGVFATTTGTVAVPKS